MDIQVTGRHVPVSERFRDHMTEKLARLEQLTNRDPRVDVVLTRETGEAGRTIVELTCFVKGPVIRAEAAHDDKYTAFDAAAAKLLERLKRSNERRRVKRRKSGFAPAGDALPPEALAPLPDAAPAPAAPDLGESPIEVRVKHHTSAPMTLEQALYEMEMVGHDFFLFTDSETQLPSVLYRRRGWSYGVLHLEAADA